MNESEFLAQQARSAKASLRRSARALGEELLEPLQLRPIIQRRPWWSLGGATLAGFVTGASLSRPARSAKPVPNGRMSRAFDSIDKRVRSLVRSAFGAIMVVNFRNASTPEHPPNDQT